MEDSDESKWEKRWLPDSQLYVYVHRITGEQSTPITPKCSCKSKQLAEEDTEFLQFSSEVDKVKEEVCSSNGEEKHDILASNCEKMLNKRGKSDPKNTKSVGSTKKRCEKRKERNSIPSKCNKVNTAYRCKKCKGKMTTLALLKTHSCHDNYLDYICCECGTVFETLNTMRKHLKDHETEEPETECYQQEKNKMMEVGDKAKSDVGFKCICLTCKKTFTTICYAVIHMKIHSGKKPFVCSHCGKAFCDASYLHKHKRIHSNEKPFKCNICDKAFVSSSNLSHHRRSHSDSRPFKCSQCDMAFKIKSNLKQHIDYKHSASSFSCDQCPKMFAREADVQRHKIVHTNRFPHKCLQCDKMFRWQNNFKMHLKIHTKSVPTYKCTLCDKALLSKKSFDRHMFVHSGQRPFPCPVCEKTFVLKRNLRRHMKAPRVHNTQQEKLFACQECDKAFSRQYSLKIHMLKMHRKKTS
jgi:KRAB domain-containing zinc finger protein